MKAIILAAGYGNRMRPLTDNEHKTLMKVANSTIIDRIIEALLANDVCDIVVALGYRSAEMQEYLLQRYENVCRFTFVENNRYRETNNIHTLALVFEECEIDDDIILIESDLIFENSVIERAIRSPHATVALVDRYRSGMDGTVVALDGDRVVNVIPPHLQGRDFDFSDKFKTLNIYKFSRDFCQRDFKKILTYYSRTIDDNCYYELILGLLIYMHRENIYAENVDGLSWAEVDDPNDLRLAEFKFNADSRQEVLDKSWGGFWSYPIVDFAFIRNMYFPPASALSEIKNNLFELMANYGSCQKILNEKLAYLALRPVDRVIALNGAAQAFPILRAWLADRTVAIPQPGFGEYQRMFPSAVTYKDDGENFAQSFVDVCCRHDVDAVVVINPNNPTGSLIPSTIVLNQIKLYPKKFFVIDESFIDFSGEQTLEELAPTELTNFVVLKSLSKVLGVPGLRLGYVYTHNKNLYQFIMDSLPVWNMNSIAEFLLEILLKHRNSFKASIANTVRDREEFSTLLQECPAVKTVYRSGANFLLIKLNCDASKVAHLSRLLLDDHHLYVKSGSAKFDDGFGYIRFAVRLPAENKAMVDALNTVWAKHLSLV